MCWESMWRLTRHSSNRPTRVLLPLEKSTSTATRWLIGGIRMRMTAPTAATARSLHLRGWEIARPRATAASARYPPREKLNSVATEAMTTKAALAKRSIKKASKFWALDLAIRCMDLTTLEGSDTPGKVAALCAKGIRPQPGEAGTPSVAAICVYPSLVATAVSRLRGSGVKVASVATAFPSGQSFTPIKVAETREAVSAGADEIDMVIDRGAFLRGDYAKVFDEIGQLRQLVVLRRDDVPLDLARGLHRRDRRHADTDEDSRRQHAERRRPRRGRCVPGIVARHHRAPDRCRESSARRARQISGYGDRVDRFAIATRPSANIDRILERINDVAFGFRAYRSRDIAVETSRTFQVVSRFHRAIGVITIVASSVFLLCIMVLKVEERRRDIAALGMLGHPRRLGDE